MSDCTTEQRLDALYAKVPAFKCIPGCHACCGPVPFSKEERARVPEKRPPGNSCPYVLRSVPGYGAGGCAIYEVRPFMCRIFGTFAGLRCPLGRGPGILLTDRHVHVLLAEYREIVGPDLGLGHLRARARHGGQVMEKAK